VSNAQKLHAFLFCRTSPGNVPAAFQKQFDKGVQKDYEHMHQFGSEVASAIRYPYVEHALLGADFNKEKVINELVKAASYIHSNDIVILYFSTHGYVIKGKGVFPIADLRDGELSTKMVFDSFAKMNPKTMLTLIDACSVNSDGNNGIDSTIAKTSYNPVTIKGEVDPDISRIKRVHYLSYFDNCYRIIGCAGEPGKPTYATAEGSYFTTSFINAFTNSANKTNGWFSWSEVADATNILTLRMEAKDELPNMPQWQLSTCDDHRFKPEANLDKLIPGTVSTVKTFGLDCISYKSKYVFFGNSRFHVHLRYTILDSLDSISYVLDKSISPRYITLSEKDMVIDTIPDNEIFPIYHLDTPRRRGQNFNYDFITEIPFVVRYTAYLKNGKTYGGTSQVNLGTPQFIDTLFFKIGIVALSLLIILGIFSYQCMKQIRSGRLH